jgi:hypothetical protein
MSIAPGASLLATPELVDFQSRAAYEVRLDRGVVYVDANSGEVLSSTLRLGRGRFRPNGGLPGQNPFIPNDGQPLPNQLPQQDQGGDL